MLRWLGIIAVITAAFAPSTSRAAPGDVYPVLCAGNGTWDDWACLKSVIDQAAFTGGGTIAFPEEGIFLISRTLWVGSGTRLSGNHSTIRLGQNGMPVFGIYGSNTTVEQLNIDYRGTNPGSGIFLSTAVSPISNIMIRGNTFTGRNSIAININAPGISKVEVSNNDFLLTLYGVLVDSLAFDLSDLRITDNRIKDVFGDGVEINSPIFASGGSGIIGKAASRIVISGNVISAPNTQTYAAGFCIGIAGAHSVEISHNQMTRCRFAGVHLEDYAHDITISGNSISEVPGDPEIGWSGSTAGIWLDRCQSVMIFGNSVRGARDVGIDLNYDGTSTGYNSGIIIAHNLVFKSGSYGIRVGGMPYQNVAVSVIGNTVWSSGVAPFYASGNPLGVTVSGNQFSP